MLAGLRRRRHHATWLTLVILVLAALAPGISRSLAFARGDIVAAGAHCLMAAAPAADGTQERGQSGGGLLDHCPFCQLRGDTPAPPPPPLALPDARGLRHETPVTAFPAPPLAAAWRHAQPRGPPALA